MGKGPSTYYAHRTCIVAISTGLRRMELLNLPWRAVHLADPDGPYAHVEKSRSKAGIRDVAIPPAVADALFEHRGVSRYDADYVLAHLRRAPAYALSGTRSASARR